MEFKNIQQVLRGGVILSLLTSTNSVPSERHLSIISVPLSLLSFFVCVFSLTAGARVVIMQLI